METPTHSRREIVFLLLVVLMLGFSAALFGAFEGFRFGYWAGQGVDPTQLGRIPIAFHGDDVISRIRFSYLAACGACIVIAVYSAIRGSNRSVTIFFTAATTVILLQLLYFKRLVVQSADNVAIVNPHFHLIGQTIVLDWLLIIVSVGLLTVAVFAKYSRSFQWRSVWPGSIVILVAIATVDAQESKWQSFKALETPRAEVEKVLGKPTKYFETFGRYETEFGEFTVWYTSGRCDPKGGRRQFKTEPQLLFQLLVDLPKAFTVKDLVWDISTFNQYGYPNDDRQVHSSPDDSLAYTTGRRKNGEEHLLTASIQPGINQMHLLCEGSDATGNQ